MGFIEKLNLLIGLYLAPLKSFWKGKLWLPFLIYAFLQAVLLILLVSYANPHIYPVLSPLVRLLGEGRDDFFSHYPGLFLMLPQVFDWGKIFLGIILEGLAAGLTSILFLKILAAKTGEEAIKPGYAFSRWLHLAAVWSFITVLLVVTISWLLPTLFSGLLHGSPRRALFFDMGLRLLTVFIYAIFIYAVPSVVVNRKSVWGALKQSISYFLRHPIFSFFLALFPYLLSVPGSFAISRADVIVSKFSPELVFYILLIGVVIDLFVNFVLTGAIVKFLVEEES
ncbi:MAG: hypothetical protein NT002_05145 [candidate division Zixibacteria bacterium]|nr:hypothetical protein [candidate division Zixibacteria bacterium]